MIVVEIIIYDNVGGFCMADSVVGGDTGIVEKGVDHGDNDGFFGNVLIPIPTKDLSFGMSFATDAKSLWLHFWYRLVGNRSQYDRLFRRLSCKHVSINLDSLLTYENYLEE